MGEEESIGREVDMCMCVCERERERADHAFTGAEFLAIDRVIHELGDGDVRQQPAHHPASVYPSVSWPAPYSTYIISHHI